MKKISFILLFLCALTQLNAQTRNSTISGKVLDSNTKEGIELAGIRLLNASDSTYVSGTATDAAGKFTLSVKPAKYIVQVTFLGYTTLNINADARQNVSLGDILMTEDGIMLGEMVVTAVAPEIQVRGDTVEYNADSYKVQEGAVLEDLIRRIPGAEIDSDGKIKVNGKDISKILVDGKEFFSNDPTTASQNLPAKMVEKLQVLDKKSDMAQLTGFDDGEEETVINLVVKPGMKEGIMSNFLVGHGNKDRYEGNGFGTYAKNDSRVTLLANINNTNNANANVRGPGRAGLLTTKEGGLNLAGESSKLKYDADVSFNRTENDVSSVYNREFIGKGTTETGATNSYTTNNRFNVRGRLEWEVDSLTKIIFRPNISYNKSDSWSLDNISRTSPLEPESSFATENKSSSKSDTWGFNGNLLLNRRLNDKGRSITLELSGGTSVGNTDGISYSLTDYVNIPDSSVLLDQIYQQDNNSYNWRLRLSYLEPIWRNAEKTKMNFLEVAYSLRSNYSETDKKTYDRDPVTEEHTVVANDYTRRTENAFLNQNVTVSFQAKRQKYNYTLGVGLEPSSTKTTTIQPGQEDRITPRRNYLNFVPRGEFNYLWDRRHNIRLRYDGQTNQASTNQLFDGIISQNAMDTTRGNPNLKPSFTHNFNLRYQKFNPERASFIMAFARLNYTTNDIISITRWGAGNSKNTTYTNIDGNMNGFFRFMYNTPLRNRKFSINAGTNGNYSRRNTYITRDEDPQRNTANTYSIGEDLRLKFNSDVFQFNVGANIRYESTRHSIQENQNRDIYNYGGFTDFTLYLPYNFAVESDISYSSNSGYEGGYEQNMWLWNASLSKQVLKNNGTIRFKIYDILQDRSNITSSSGTESTTFTTYNTINSYFMVNFIYRFNSFKGGMKSSDMEPQQRGPGRGGPPRHRM